MLKSNIIVFRDQQDIKSIGDDEQVKAFAPAWVEKALEKIAPKFYGTKFEIGSYINDNFEPSGKQYEIKQKMTLIDLIAIARNERANTNGIIKYAQYPGISNETIIALRDLAKHCVMVGKDIATHFGGFPGGEPQELNQEVYICDLPGLQFQQLDNTGRHVLISQEGDFPKGALDDEIYENTVGEKKFTLEKAQQDTQSRFLTGKFKDKAVLFDTIAYQAFIMQDFILAATTLNAQAKSAAPQAELNFKFLKYGAGFFLNGLEGEAKNKLSENLAIGVLKGIQQLLKLSPESRSQIKRIELPYYRETNNQRLDEILKEIETLCTKNGLEFASTKDDMLAQTSKKYKTATTNCSDPHAPFGNEMNYGSVDAAIAENLARKGNNFNPIFNTKMKEAYLTISHLLHQIHNKPLEVPVVLTPQTKPALSILSKIKWSVISALFVGALVKSGQALLIGLTASWTATLASVVIAFVGLEIIRLARNEFKKSQHHQYQQKTQHDLDKLNNIQLSAFNIGRKSAKSTKNQIFGLCSWQAYRSPKAFYAGYEAQQKQDKSLLARVPLTKLNRA
ncbi:MAG: hypothetical protein JSS07_09875 [Proteobacteria bacterium]|nr:hypothetical protein [Pseudomonadota bacterium]